MKERKKDWKINWITNEWMKEEWLMNERANEWLMNERMHEMNEQVN